MSAEVGNLGCVAYHQGDYRRAEQQLQQALELWADMGHAPYRAWVLSQLGHVAVGEARPAAAGDYYRQALHLSTRHNLAPFALEIFCGAARLLAQAGETGDIPDLLALAQHHPAGTADTKAAARRLYTELALLLPGENLPPDPTLDWQAVAGRIGERLDRVT